MQQLGTLFAALLGLAFGSFLNVVLVRFPEDESLSTPRSHCRNCAHTLAWWENLPVLSWIILRARCRQCQTPISIRYPLIELTIGILWAWVWIKFSQPLFADDTFTTPHQLTNALLQLIGHALFAWLLVALAALDAEYFWLPDWFTLPGIVLGYAVTIALAWTRNPGHHPFDWSAEAWPPFVELLAPAAVVLVIRLAYWLVRRKEGMGLGDAKLMAMLGAWLGLIGALECFALAVFGATAAAFLSLAASAIRRDKAETREWAKAPLPLGTFLCIAALSEIFYPDWPWELWTRWTM